MSFFGEYLVTKKLVTKEDLLHGLVEQMRRVAPPWQIIMEQQLLSVDEILKVIEIQVMENIDFKSAALKAKIWTETVDEAVADAVKLMRIPIGQILVEQGKLTFQQLTEALDEYVNLREKMQKAEFAK